MLKRLLLSLFISLLSWCVIGNCTHIHTAECGENGVNCVHECYEINPCIDEPVKL